MVDTAGLCRKPFLPAFCVVLAWSLAGCATEHLHDATLDETATVSPALSSSPSAAMPSGAPDPLPDPEPIESSDTDARFDPIRRDDPSALACLEHSGIFQGEFHAIATDTLETVANTVFFDAMYHDGTQVEIRVHPQLGSARRARVEAERIARAFGRLPAVLRAGVTRIGIRTGDRSTRTDTRGDIQLHWLDVERRIATNRFEEILFHEAVHVSLDDRYARSPDWIAAQQADGRFLTVRARSLPDREDLAETALYAYALLHHPERIPADDAAEWRARVPARIDVIAAIFPHVDAVPAGDVACESSR